MKTPFNNVREILLDLKGKGTQAAKKGGKVFVDVVPGPLSVAGAQEKEGKKQLESSRAWESHNGKGFLTGGSGRGEKLSGNSVQIPSRKNEGLLQAACAGGSKRRVVSKKKEGHRKGKEDDRKKRRSL